MIKELGLFLTRSENVYFAKNEQTSITVFTAVSCTHMSNIIWLNKLLDNNLSAQAVNSISEGAM